MAISASFNLLQFPQRPKLLSLSFRSLDARALIISTSRPRLLLQEPPPVGSKSHRPCSSGKTSDATSQQQSSLQEYYLKEELIGAIEEKLCSFVKGGDTQIDFHEALTMVDLIERLGIQRFFQQQIDRILISAYMRWDEKYGLTDANLTALGFRLLRLHGYNLSGDVLKTLRDQDDGSFSVFLLKTSDKVSGSVNLYKCSQIGFPKESAIMDQAEDFSSTQLTEIISDVNSCHLFEQREEVKFAITYPRRYLLSRMEARSIARQSWPSSGLEGICLELACIDLEIQQKAYQQEMKELERWFDEQGFEELSFPRLGLFKCFIGQAIAMFEPQFSVYRSAFAKLAMLGVIHDDLFDLPTFDYHGICCFEEAFRRWDVSPVANLPQHKLVYISFQQNLTEISATASEVQGRDVFPYIKEVWQDLVSCAAKEAEWKLAGYVPSVQEYLPVGANTINAVAILSTTFFLLGEPISPEAHKLTSKDSRLLFLAGAISRLANDLVTIDKEKKEGKLFNAVACYMKDNPHCNKEQAFAAVKEMMKGLFREMELEMFACRRIVPGSCIRAVLGFVQAVCISYRKVDGYTGTGDTEYQELVKDYMGY